MKLLSILAFIVSVTTSFPAYSKVTQTEEAWKSFLITAKSIKKTDLFSSKYDNDLLPIKNSVEMDDIGILILHNMPKGVEIAVNDLINYLEKVTGKTINTQKSSINYKNLYFEGEIKNKNIIIIDSVNENSNITPEDNANFVITAKNYKIKSKDTNFIRIQANNHISMQYAIYHFMQLTGKRFFHYKEEFTPDIKETKLPANNFFYVFNNDSLMKIRGFSPHLYHPVPLSIAFHEPSDEHFEMMKDYIDWLVKNKQNYLLLPMLELDKKSKYLPIRDENKPKFKEWIPFANKIVNYAHQRGVKISIKLAFANFVSANSFALNPFNEISKSMDLDKKWKEITFLDKEVLAKKDLNILKKKETLEKEYLELLDKYAKEDLNEIKKLVDDFMQVSWDEITWHIGTSEFSPTNDDLTIRWMNDTYKYIKEKYPNVEMAVRSHVPPRPFSEKYNDSYFHLIKFADIGINNLIHTVQAYSLVDKAPVYGTGNFEHKLKYLYFSDPKRKDIYYPESSYWVTYDVDIPLFLPVYILNRKHDIEIVKQIDHLDGHATFTTAWEWSYWFNDYMSALMQTYPNRNLSELLSESFDVFGRAKEQLVKIFEETMLVQQDLLLDKNLHKYMKGVSWLTDFGITLKNNPLVNNFIEGTNSTPERLKPESLTKWKKEELVSFINSDLRNLEILMYKFQNLSKKIKSLEYIIPESSKSFYLEFCDSFEINYLRAKEVYFSWKAVSFYQLNKFDKNNEFIKESKIALNKAKNCISEAQKIVTNREKYYRDSSKYTYDNANEPTMWNDRYLTPVHNLNYWKTTYRESEEIVNKKSVNFLSLD